VILGPCAGGAVYSPALTDFVFVVDKISKMFITGPEVIKTVLGEEISMEELGGAKVQAEVTGNAHFYAENEIECFEQIKQLCSYIPWNIPRKLDSFPKSRPAQGSSTSIDLPDQFSSAFRCERYYHGLSATTPNL
jgi:acetyl-CoA carboxylase carboxyltransferase component